MSVPTIPAYIVHIDGSEQGFRKQPVLDFLFDHEEAFDHGDMKTPPYTNYHTNDFVFTKSDGTVLPPSEASWKGWLEGYAPFTEHLHEARYCCAYERNGGGEMMGIAHVYANLAVPGEKTKTDLSGRHWDVAVPGAFPLQLRRRPQWSEGIQGQVDDLVWGWCSCS